MKNKIISVIIFLISIITISAQENRYYYENAVFNENIKTVLMHREGFELSNPVITLGEEIPLILKFDDLSGKVKDYYYTIVHCDADWNESFLVQEDYLEGFFDNRLDDYGISFNTTFNYVNYRLFLPNENVQFKISGNYTLLVYEDNDKEKLILTQRFYVVEQSVQIEGRVRRATSDAYKGENQEVNFRIFHPNIQIINPIDEVRVVIMQNNRWDNAIRNIKPLYIRSGELNYDYKDLVFSAGNEFRYFDIRTNKVSGENVYSTEFYRPYYHKTLMKDETRSNKKYYAYEEMNGKYVVESQDQEVQDFDTECDYNFVHFSLPMESILLGGSVNVFGALTGWNANKSNEMTWNFNTSQYELTLLLKQGYYNFTYVYVPQGSTVADHKNIEGSFWQTENDYQVFVYYKDIASRYERLVGYRIFNSRKNQY